MAGKDEEYLLDLCDEVLALRCLRQHTFDFLRGDTGRRLPVDGYYPELGLVIEYRERQHFEEVPFFDGKITASGIGRGAQRALYDKRRREAIPKNGLELVEFSVTDFLHNSRKRLKRHRGEDLAVIRQRLDAFLTGIEAVRGPKTTLALQKGYNGLNMRTRVRTPTF